MGFKPYSTLVNSRSYGKSPFLIGTLEKKTNIDPEASILENKHRPIAITSLNSKLLLIPRGVPRGCSQDPLCSLGHDHPLLWKEKKENSNL